VGSGKGKNTMSCLEAQLNAASLICRSACSPADGKEIEINGNVIEELCDVAVTLSPQRGDGVRSVIRAWELQLEQQEWWRSRAMIGSRWIWPMMLFLNRRSMLGGSDPDLTPKVI
jgi:hypothetical protein